MTIYDVAKLAGVSKSTVSRVINGEKSVNKEIRKRVEQVIKDNNFVPNKSARLTKRNIKTYLILVTRLDSHSENRVIRGLMEQSDANSEFLIMETNFSIEKTIRILNQHRNVNGLIIFAISNEHYEFLEDSLIPVIFIGQKINTPHTCITFDDANATMSLIKKIKNDQTKALFIGYDEQDNTKMIRYNCSKQQLNVDTLDYISARFSPEDSRNLATLEDLGKYNTFICATDQLALSVYSHILKQNIRNYVMTGFGNNRKINFIFDNFYTVDFHYKQAGRIIANILQGTESIGESMPYTIIEK